MDPSAPKKKSHKQKKPKREDIEKEKAAKKKAKTASLKPPPSAQPPVSMSSDIPGINESLAKAILVLFWREAWHEAGPG
jgi:hypothetical protein